MARAAGRIVGLPGVACQSVGVARGTAGRRAGRMIGGRTTTGRRGAGDSRALGVAKAAGICLALGVGVSCSSCENRGYFAGLDAGADNSRFPMEGRAAIFGLPQVWS